MRAWRHGDRSALERLLRRYQAYVLRLCQVAGAGSHEHAREWAQAAMLTVVRHLDRFDGTRPFKPWLRQVVLNSCRHQRDAERRHQAMTSPLEAFDTAAAPDSPEAQALQRAELRAVSQVWSTLPPEWRLALWLRAVDGLSYDEIAQAGSWPQGTAKTYVYRARQALRAALFEGDVENHGDHATTAVPRRRGAD